MESVKTALRVVAAIAQAGVIGLSELARKLEEPKATVQRNLNTLHEAGWIRPIQSGNHRHRRVWTLTTIMLTLGRSAVAEPRLLDVAIPVMERLHRKTQETIHLTVPEGRSMVLIEQMESLHALRATRPMGMRVPLHLASGGKAVLAYSAVADQERYLMEPLERATSKSITDPGVLRRELKKIRASGFAVVVSELDESLRAVGSAILNKEQRPIAALSIFCPAVRLSNAKIPRFGKLVRVAAAEIGAALAAG